MAALGIKFTGEIALTPVPGPSEKEIETLRAVVDEAKKVGVLVQVHAVSSPAMMAAVDVGVPLLVHLPNKDWVSKEDAKKLAASGTKIADDDRLRRARVRRVRERQQAAVPRRQGLAVGHRRRRAPRRGSGLHDRQRAHACGTRA